jgi:DNA-binding transcriptional ArsR family regulator
LVVAIGYRKLYIHMRVYILVESAVFETLADPTRLRIVEALGTGEHPVHELVDVVDIHQSGVSRHLRILHDAGFVRVRAKGQERLYSLRADPFRELDQWIRRYRELWEARLDRFGAELDRRERTRAAKRMERKK